MLEDTDSALSTQHSGLSTQHSGLSTQHSALRTQDSALRTQDSALTTSYGDLGPSCDNHYQLRSDLVHAAVRLPAVTRRCCYSGSHVSSAMGVHSLRILLSVLFFV